MEGGLDATHHSARLPHQDPSSAPSHARVTSAALCVETLRASFGRRLQPAARSGLGARPWAPVGALARGSSEVCGSRWGTRMAAPPRPRTPHAGAARCDRLARGMRRRRWRRQQWRRRRRPQRRRQLSRELPVPPGSVLQQRGRLGRRGAWDQHGPSLVIGRRSSAAARRRVRSTAPGARARRRRRRMRDNSWAQRCGAAGRLRCAAPSI
eukprot:358504-Chlamydomonas_euryale.AAC.9